ncbi:hypothetical protein CDAR_402001 [Caerostris darwini]|uniref:Uncharacterized protein n=1 Tax=Caerostris darwini TaxID=1538125 RepID=A0AAV4NUW7_9ARAC|nr:hypothetical protein CDAR_402001 [Caerostris darwini]
MVHSILLHEDSTDSSSHQTRPWIMDKHRRITAKDQSLVKKERNFPFYEIIQLIILVISFGKPHLRRSFLCIALVHSVHSDEDSTDSSSHQTRP